MEAPTHRGLALVGELARRFQAGAFDAAFELYHPAIQIVQPESLPHGGVHEGRDGVRAMGALFAKFWTRSISSPRRSACGEGVLQITQQTWTSLASGRSASVEVMELFSFAEDMVKEIRVFQHDTHRLMATLDRPRLWERTDELTVVDAATVATLGKQWEEGFNAEQVESVVASFAEDVLFTSPFISRISGERSLSTIRGTSAVKRYLADSFLRAKDIRYTLDASYAGVDTVVLCYTVHHPRLGERSGVDTLRLDATDKVVEWRCHYPFES